MGVVIEGREGVMKGGGGDTGREEVGEGKEQEVGEGMCGKGGREGGRW